MEPFVLKQFQLNHSFSAMKIGTDSILLGSWIKTSDFIERILDVGAGSGILSLMCAQKFKKASIIAVEIDKEAAAECQSNFENSPWSNRIQVHHSDINNFSSNDFDLIVCNPPYFKHSLNSPDQARSIARHNITLDFPTLFFNINRLLSKNGLAYIVVPFSSKNEIQFEAGKFGLSIKSLLYIRNTESHECKRVLIELHFNNQIKIEESTLIIRTKEGNYTNEFILLTQDYYTDTVLFQKNKFRSL